MKLEDNGLWLPEGALQEAQRRQVADAMVAYGEPEPMEGPFDKLGRFKNFGWYEMYGLKTRADWLRRADGSS